MGPRTVDRASEGYIGRSFKFVRKLSFIINIYPVLELNWCVCKNLINYTLFETFGLSDRD